MPRNPAASSTARPSRAQILEAFEGEPLSTEALLRFCALPADLRARIKDQVAPEPWGEGDAVLLQYLAVHLRMAIAQGQYVWDGGLLVMRAGHLVTPEGEPVYLGIGAGELAWAGRRPGTVEPLQAADLGPWLALDARLDVAIGFDRFHSEALAGLPLVTQGAAVAGAVLWSLRRGLAVRRLRGESRGYLAPVHLTDRDAAPEHAASVAVQSGRLLVRGLVEPGLAYATARAVVERRDMPAWLLDAWDQDGHGPCPG